VDFDTDPFDSLYRHLDCPKCGEHIVVGLSNNIKKYGFECPFCGAITNAEYVGSNFRIKNDRKF